MGIPEKIKEIEEEIHKTQINKATEFHIGILKAKIAKLKRELEENRHGKTVSSGKGSSGYDVRKEGDATVVLIGFPSVGKSTLLNSLTNANSKIASYQFTTLTAIPGMMEYRGAKIQVIDLPGIIKGAASGKGMDKIDLIDTKTLNGMIPFLGEDVEPVSANSNLNIEMLKESIFNKLEFMRIYMRPKGKETDYVEPLIVRKGTKVKDICAKLHRNMLRDFRFALVSGNSAKFEGQKVGLDHELLDQDVLTIIKKINAL